MTSLRTAGNDVAEQGGELALLSARAVCSSSGRSYRTAFPLDVSEGHKGDDLRATASACPVHVRNHAEIGNRGAAGP